MKSRWFRAADKAGYVPEHIREVFVSLEDRNPRRNQRVRSNQNRNQ
jgi:hypothetical protein